MKVDWAKFSRDYRAAHEAGVAAAAASSDGGTCCFDAPAIRFAGARGAQERLKEIVGDVMWWRHGRAWVLPGGVGQAAKRTKYADVVAAALRAMGWETTVYYQMD